MKKITAVLFAIILAVISVVACAEPAAALDFTCGSSGQVRIRLFDFYDKNTAIYTVCALPNLPGVTGEGFVLPSSANNDTKSVVVRAGPSIKDNQHICIFFWDRSDFAGFIENEDIAEGQEHWFNLDPTDADRISAFDVFYC